MSVARHQCPYCKIMMTKVKQTVSESEGVTYILTKDGWQEKDHESSTEVSLYCGHCGCEVDSTAPGFEIGQELP